MMESHGTPTCGVSLSHVSNFKESRSQVEAAARVHLRTTHQPEFSRRLRWMGGGTEQL